MKDDRDIEKSKDKIELVGTNEDQDSVAFRCKYCEYTWNTTSDRAYISCPNCHRQTKFKEGALDRLQIEGEVASLLVELKEEKGEGVGIEELLIEALTLWERQRGGIDEPSQKVG